MLKLIETKPNQVYDIEWKGKQVGYVRYHNHKELNLDGWKVYGLVGNAFKDRHKHACMPSYMTYNTIEDVSDCIWYHYGLRQRTVTSFPMYVDNPKWYESKEIWIEKVETYEKKYGKSAIIIKDYQNTKTNLSVNTICTNLENMFNHLSMGK